MNADRLEALLRFLSVTPSRRGTLRLMVRLVLGGRLTYGITGADAHDKLDRCKKIDDKDKRKRCVKKAKKHKARHVIAPVCPPVCPFCQRCNPTSGLCGFENGLPGQDCAAPKVCCSGVCCQPIHVCNAAGACATCAEVCPANCEYCLYLADGSTTCVGNYMADCNKPCVTVATCSAGEVCATGATVQSTNAPGPFCVGSNGFCTSDITPCA